LKVLSFFLILLLFGCDTSESFECPCGGYGVVANGTIITIDEKNEGDTRIILDAIEERLGGECCYVEEGNGLEPRGKIE
jgi:hypothetical protein